MKNYLDRWIFFIVLGLMAFGIIMVYSSSAFYAERFRGDHLYYLKRQLLWVFAGIFVMLAASRFPYRKLQGKTPAFIILSIALLIYLLASPFNRWIIVGNFHLQVSDVARLSLILFLADSLQRKEEFLSSYGQGFVPHMVYVVVFAGLILFQPDFSSAAMIVIISLAIMWVSPIPIRYFLYSFSPLLIPAYFAVIHSAYKLDRVTAFLHPESDVLGKGYQIIQSLISLGSGGIVGVGFAQSKQKMFFLPEAHTDFIFSIIGEEWGLIGTVFILLLFFLLMWRGIALVNRARDNFSRYLAMGLTANLILYALVNMMVAAHLAPPTGLPLPFVSYGGSSMLVCSISAGLLMNISSVIHSEPEKNNFSFATRARRNWEERKLRFVR